MPPRRVPPLLLVAAALAGLEGLVLLAYSVGEAVHLSSDRMTMGVTTAAFFAAYGGFLVWCALAIVRLRSWARSPLVLGQLIQLGVAWGFWGGTTTPVALGLALAAVVTLLGLLAPSSIQALEAEDA